MAWEMAFVNLSFTNNKISVNLKLLIDKCTLISVLWTGKFKFSKLVANYGSFSACGLFQSLLDCLNYCHPVPFMCWNNLLMSWGNYLSSFFVGVLCVMLFLIHTDKYNAKTAAYIVFPSKFFLHPCGLTLCCILRVLGWPNRPQNDPKTQ